MAKVHRDAKRFASEGLEVVVIGHKGHAEVTGIVGEAPGARVYPDLPDSPANLGVVCQTTMNSDDVRSIVEDLSSRYNVVASAQVCHATKERQDAVKAFDGDAILVLGGANSSNSRRLAEVAPCRSFMAGSMDELKAIDFSGIEVLGVTAGASTPEEFLEEAVQYLQKLKG